MESIISFIASQVTKTPNKLLKAKNSDLYYRILHIDYYNLY